MHTHQHLPLELLETFSKIVEHEGDASAAAQALGISQPSISRRLSQLRKLVDAAENRPWLILKGKRWLLTPSGERVFGVISDLVRKHAQVEQFIAETNRAKPIVSIACGQTAASGTVKRAIEELLEQHPSVQVRLSMPRGKARIAGVAAGQYDLAIVTDDEATIRDVARIELHIDALQQDHFVLAAQPTANSAWAKAWQRLPSSRPLTATDLGELPLILPEPDASRRQQFERWYKHNTNQSPNVVLEIGGWHNILRFAQAGLGIGFATESAVQSFGNPTSTKAQSSLTVRRLDPKEFPPDAIRLITRKQPGHSEPDLSHSASLLYQLLLQQSK